ncbi:hypothetical protein DRQ05_04500, partial [bacterium]
PGLSRSCPDDCPFIHICRET